MGGECKGVDFSGLIVGTFAMSFPTNQP